MTQFQARVYTDPLWTQKTTPAVTQTCSWPASQDTGWRVCRLTTTTSWLTSRPSCTSCTPWRGADNTHTPTNTAAAHQQVRSHLGATIPPLAPTASCINGLETFDCSWQDRLLGWSYAALLLSVVFSRLLFLSSEVQQVRDTTNVATACLYNNTVFDTVYAVIFTISVPLLIQITFNLFECW